MFTWHLFYNISYSTTNLVPAYGYRLLVGVTLLAQLFCGSAIIYCKWQQWRKEQNDVIPIRIQANNPESGNGQMKIQETQRNQRLNTSLTNKILPDLKHLTCFGLYSLTLVFLQFYKNHFLPYSTTIQSKIMMYIINLFPKFLFSIVFPLLFYISHKELRNYWKKQITAVCNNMKYNCFERRN